MIMMKIISYTCVFFVVRVKTFSFIVTYLINCIIYTMVGAIVKKTAMTSAHTQCCRSCCLNGQSLFNVRLLFTQWATNCWTDSLFFGQLTASSKRMNSCSFFLVLSCTFPQLRFGWCYSRNKKLRKPIKCPNMTIKSC